MLKKEIREILKSDTEGKKVRENGFDIAFKAAEVGEEAGFVRGFRYAVQVMMECR